MLTKEQYESIQPHRQVLDLFDKTKTCVGGIDGLYPIYDAITGTTISRGCGNCKGMMLIELNLMIKQYEDRNL